LRDIKHGVSADSPSKSFDRCEHCYRTDGPERGDFWLIEMRHARKEREERAAFVAMQAILTPAWMRSMVLVQSIP